MGVGRRYLSDPSQLDDTLLGNELLRSGWVTSGATDTPQAEESSMEQADSLFPAKANEWV